jgi:hypothetical protein
VTQARYSNSKLVKGAVSFSCCKDGNVLNSSDKGAYILARRDASSTAKFLGSGSRKYLGEVYTISGGIGSKMEAEGSTFARDRDTQITFSGERF